jgi:hypothetical protein
VFLIKTCFNDTLTYNLFIKRNHSLPTKEKYKMDKLVVFNPSSQSLSSDVSEDNVERIENSVNLKPGTYWRCKKEPEQPGSWRKGYQWMPSYAKNEILLLTDVKDDDNGYAHTVELLMTPERQEEALNGGKVKLLVAEFHEDFMLEERGEEIRKEQAKNELAKLEGIKDDIGDIRTNPDRLMQVLNEGNEAEYEEVKNKISALRSLPSPTAGTNLQNMNDAKNAVVQLEAKREIANATQIVLTKVNKKLNTQIKLIGTYYGEIGELAMAQTKDAHEIVENVQQSLKTLDIYLGKEVEVYSVKKGVLGSPDEKYKIYQDLLFMDEESLINCKGQGADFEDIPLFFSMINEDDSLLNRLFPFERSIIIIRPRRTDRDYNGENPFSANQKNQNNKMSFLMVRNGDEVTAIFHPMEFMKRLFPSQAEMDNAFQSRSWTDCTNITKEDLKYTDALSNAEKIRRQYKRMVLMLQGVYERNEEKTIFGEMPIDGELNLLNPYHQAQCFDFVTTESIIEDNRRPSYSEWFKSLNSDMRIGSLVMLSNNHIDEDNTPGIYSGSKYDDYRSTDWKIKDPVFYHDAHIVQKHGDKIGIKVPFEHYDSDKKARNFVVEVLPTDMTCIDLEKVRSSDIDYYLNSRKERESYLGFIYSLLKLRKFASLEEKRVEKASIAVKKVLSEMGKDVDDELVFQSIMKYRANNNGMFDDNTHEKAHKIEKILNVYWQLTGGSKAFVDNVINIMGNEKVVIVAADAKNTFFVYTYNEENALSFDESGFPWLSKYKVEDVNSSKLGKAVASRISEIKGSLSYLYKSEDFTDINKDQNNRHTLTFRQFKNLLDKVKLNAAPESDYMLSSLEGLCSGTFKEMDYQNIINELIGGCSELRRTVKGKNLNLPVMSIPLGLATDKKGKLYTVRTILNTYDLLAYFYHVIPDDLKEHWGERAMLEVKRNLNDHHVKNFYGNSGKENPMTFFAADVDKMPTGLKSKFNEDTTGTETYLIARKELGFRGLKLSNMEQVFYIDDFISKYPNLSECLTNRSVGADGDDVISLKDIRSTIEYEKAHNRLNKIQGLG